MDGQRLKEAMDAAGEALAASLGLRDPTLEARLLCVRRSLEYRLGALRQTDADLIEILGLTGARSLQGVAALTEAAIAWRSGHGDAARGFAVRSSRLLAGIDFGTACLPDALRIACSQTTDAEDVLTVAAAAARCPKPGVAVQALGLLGIARPDLAEELRIPDSWLEALPRWTWEVRREVLSIEEALSRRVERNDQDGSANATGELRGQATRDGLGPRSAAP
jgi:hypothetical protein